MELTNKQNLPQAIVNIVKKTTYPPKPKRYGITTLLKGDTEIILTKRFHKDIIEDVSDDIWALFGTMFHEYISNHDTTGFSEYKVEIPVSKSVVVGVIDFYDKKNNEITDYKTTTVWKITFKDYEDWRNQLLGYCWALWKKSKGKIVCLKGTIIAILRDWQKSKAIQGGNYPKSNVVKVNFDFTIDDLIEFDNFITSKVKRLENQKYWQTKALKECSEKEKWTTPTTYAIYKNDNKTATKVCESESEANNVYESLQENDPKNKYTIVERKGQDKKCIEYCRVRFFCPFREVKNE